jgi:hypothetical protein
VFLRAATKIESTGEKKMKATPVSIEVTERSGWATAPIADATQAVQRWIQIGMMAIPVYGLLTGWATLTHQPDAQTDFASYAQYISTPEFFAHHIIGSIGGTILALYGVIALFASLMTRRGAGVALAGLLASVAGNILIVSLFGVAAFAAPVIGEAYLAGNHSMTEVNSAIYSMPLGLTGLTGGLFYSLGTILFGVAIWRSKVLPKSAGVLYAVAGPLLSLFGLFIGAAQTVGSVSLIIAGVWLTWTVWHQR